jgi:hypothetical protein
MAATGAMCTDALIKFDFLIRWLLFSSHALSLR